MGIPLYTIETKDSIYVAFIAVVLTWILVCVPAYADGNQTPHCTLQVAPPSGTAPLNVTASGSCKEGNRSITVVLDWGEGAPPSTEAPFFTGTHTYKDNGVFPVTVTATDNEGNSGSATQTVTVAPLRCAPTATPSNGQAPVTISVEANCTDSKASITSIFIDFGDGYYQSGTSMNHTYLTGGNFDVTVHAGDASGNTAVGTVQVSVASPASIFVGINNGQVRQFGKDGAVIQTLSTNQAGSTTGMGFDLFGNLYVTDFTADAVSRFSGSGNLMGTFGGGYNCKPESVVFDRAGNAYVGETGCSHAILKFDPYGNLTASYQVATEVEGSDWIDLAPDRCTIYYTSQGKSVLRYNTCNQQQLAPLTSSLQSGLAVRALPDSGALVANLTNIVRLDSNGNIVTTYDAPGENCWSGLTLDSDGSSFWATDYCTSDVFRFQIASGAQIVKFNSGTPTNTVYGVATFATSQSASAGVFIASPGSVSISRGQAASYSLSFDPNDAAQGQTFTFSCADLPVGASCAFSPGSVTANGHAESTLTINTATVSTSSAPSINWNAAMYGLMFPFLWVVLMPASRREFNTMRFVLLIAVLVLTVQLIGCAGASNGTNGGTTVSAPPVPSTGATASGTYTVILHTSSDGLQSSTTVQLLVQ